MDDADLGIHYLRTSYCHKFGTVPELLYFNALDGSRSLTSHQAAARRLPGTTRRDLGPLINLAEFKKPVYSFYVAALVINSLALNTVGAFSERYTELVSRSSSLLCAAISLY